MRSEKEIIDLNKRENVQGHHLNTERDLKSMQNQFGLSPESFDGLSVLDIGSGKSFLAQELTEKKIETNIVSMDPVRIPEGIKKWGLDSYEKPQRFSPDVTKKVKEKFVFGMAEGIPFKDNYFDRLIVSYSAPYYARTEDQINEQLREMLRVVKLGGEIYSAPLYVDHPPKSINDADAINEFTDIDSPFRKKKDFELVLEKLRSEGVSNFSVEYKRIRGHRTIEHYIAKLIKLSQ